MRCIMVLLGRNDGQFYGLAREYNIEMTRHGGSVCDPIYTCTHTRSPRDFVSKLMRDLYPQQEDSGPYRDLLSGSTCVAFRIVVL